MDFHEMRQAYTRAVNHSIETTVSELITLMPDIDDLKQRLVDKHAVTWDPICAEAAECITVLEQLLIKRELQMTNILRAVLSALELPRTAETS